MLQRHWDFFSSHLYIYEQQGQNERNYSCIKVTEDRSSAHMDLR